MIGIMAKSKIHVMMIRERRSHLIKGMATCNVSMGYRMQRGKNARLQVGRAQKQGSHSLRPVTKNGVALVQMEKKSAHEDLMCIK